MIPEKFQWLVKLRDLLVKEPQVFNMRYHSTCAIGFAIDRGILPGEWIKLKVGYTDRRLTDKGSRDVYAAMGLPHEELLRTFDRFGYHGDGKEVSSELVVEKINTFLMGQSNVIS